MTDPTMSMVERVARALRAADARNGSEVPGSSSDPYYQMLARAAVASMREPTAEMIQAGERTLTEPRDVSGYPCACDEAAVWKAMIDAALSDEKAYRP